MTSSPEAPAWTMTGRYQKRVDIAGPGPGAYDPSLTLHGPKYSLTGRNFGDKDSQKVPGPGTYSVTKISAYTCSARNPPSFSIGSRASAKEIRRDNTPGPCDYNTTKHASQTGFSFGRPARRSASQKDDDTPGPGEYQVSHTRDGPKYSIRGAKQIPTSSSSKMPGPANYFPTLPKQQPSHSIGSGQRFKKDNAFGHSMPGPGDYDIRSSIVTFRSTPAISIASKPTMQKYSASTPGPTEYTPELRKKGKGFSLLGRHKDSSLAQSPGPGAYNTVRDASKSRDFPAYSIGSKPRGRGDLAKIYGPGPGCYNPKSANRTAPKYSLAGRTRTNEDRTGIEQMESPGPGDYSTRSPPRNGPAFSLGAKLKTTHLM